MVGRTFTEIVSPRDQDRFRRCANLAASSRIPQCLPVTLQLSAGPREATMLIVSTYVRTKLHYLIGITLNVEVREWESEAAAAACPNEASEMIARIPRQGQQVERSGRQLSGSQDDVFSALSAQSSASMGFQDPETYAIFDALSPNMTFTSVSPGWMDLYYHSAVLGADANLAGWMTSELMQKFRDWLKPRVARVLAGGWQAADATKLFRRARGQNQGHNSVGSVVRLCVTLFDPSESYDIAAGTYLAKFAVVERSAHAHSGSTESSLPSVAEEVEESGEEERRSGRSRSTLAVESDANIHCGNGRFAL